MVVFPTKIEDMNKATVKELLNAVIMDVRNNCTNIYSPKYKTLQNLRNWVDKHCPNKTLKEIGYKW